MRRVCVVGAGAAGLAAARHSIDCGVFEVDIYEQSDQVGGTWVYSDMTGCHSSMYSNLVTNLPKEVMQYRDHPFPEHLGSFLKHHDVLKYLQNFATGMPIHFNRTVENIERNVDDTKWVVTVHHGAGTEQLLYDVVFVCNGHYSQPNNPYKESEFQGKLLHSHDYRKAEDYQDQDVVVIGAGPSGIDIALQLSETARHITLISRKAKYNHLPDNIRQIPYHVTKVTPTGCEVETDEHITSDTIIVCTGYFYKFPFLNEKIVKVKEDGHLVSPIFEHVVHAKYPTSLFFIGLNLVSITFPLFEYQVKLALAFATGHASIPSEAELVNFEEQHIQHQSGRGLKPRFYHLLECEQWEYLRRIARLGNFDTWNYMDLIEKMTKCVHERKHQNIMMYKKMNFRLNSNATDFDIM